MDIKSSATYLTITFLLFSTLFWSCNEKNTIDLIVHNGSIYTVDDAFSVVEAMAIDKGKIIETGPEHQILNKYAASTYIDCKTQYVYPGFIDAHCHFLAYGLMHDDIDLIGTSSLEEIIEILGNHVVPDSGKWIIGRGWDQNDWEEKEYPSKKVLDSIFPNHPVVLKRIDGHAYWVNSRALELSHINANTTIEGGMVLSNESGATGILIDNACDLVNEQIPKPTNEEMTEALAIAEKECLAYGLTAVADAGLTSMELNFLKDANEKQQYYMKIYAMIAANDEFLDEWLSGGAFISDNLVIRSVKLYADGALGSRGAMLLEPYHDHDEHMGLRFISPDSVLRLGKKILDNGFQLNTHAIGDSANRMMLNCYGQLLETTNDKRWRIEHAQVVHPEDLTLFREFTIIPSVQPTHATSDMPWAETRLGDQRVKTAYAYNDLLKQNGLLALGTDFPVEGISPLATFRSAISRTNGKNEAFQMENAISREQALRGMTIWAAISNFQDSLIGSIEAGKDADFVLMRKDLMKCDVSMLNQEDILATYVKGAKMYDANGR